MRGKYDGLCSFFVFLFPFYPNCAIWRKASREVVLKEYRIGLVQLLSGIKCRVYLVHYGKEEGEREEGKAGLRVLNGRIEMAETTKGNKKRMMGSCMPLGFFFVFVYAIVTVPPWWDCVRICV